MEQWDVDKIKTGNRYRKDLGDIKAMASSIEKIGLLHPIVIQPDGTLIAGMRRLEACKLLGWKSVPVRVISLENILRGEHDENVFRKDFTPSEAVAIGEALEPLERQAAKERMLAGKPCENFTQGSGKSLDKVAAVVGMSRPTYQKAKEIVQYAQTIQMPELIEIMDEKGIEHALKRKHEIEIEQRRAELARAAEQVPPSERWRIWQDDIRTARLDEQVDAIITDPPYPREYLPLWDELGRFAKENLKTGGVLLAMAPGPYLPQIIEMLGRHLTYQWVLACELPGQSASAIQSGVRNIMWKPILVYRNGGDPINIGSDLFRNNKSDKNFHEWGQGLDGYEWQVENFTQPNDIICDPFLGGGTTAIAALKHGRRFVGFDVDAESVSISKGRLKDCLLDLSPAQRLVGALLGEGDYW